MAAAHTAHVVEEDQHTVVRFEGKVSLPNGPVLVRQNDATGEVTLTPMPTEQPNPWIEFFEAMLAVPRDEQWHEFMRIMEERPMNQLPIDRKLFREEE